jgi:hypothetical protein
MFELNALNLSTIIFNWAMGGVTMKTNGFGKVGSERLVSLHNLTGTSCLTLIDPPRRPVEELSSWILFSDINTNISRLFIDLSPLIRGEINTSITHSLSDNSNESNIDWSCNREHTRIFVEESIASQIKVFSEDFDIRHVFDIFSRL